jgi:hypothetical protein
MLLTCQTEEMQLVRKGPNLCSSKRASFPLDDDIVPCLEMHHQWWPARSTRTQANVHRCIMMSERISHDPVSGTWNHSML